MLLLFTSTRSPRWYLVTSPRRWLLLPAGQTVHLISSLRNAVQPARCAHVYHHAPHPTLSRAVESANAHWLQRLANASQAAAGITTGPVNTGSQRQKQSKSAIGRYRSSSCTHNHTTVFAGGDETSCCVQTLNGMQDGIVLLISALTNP
jgi:hypothetical protein